jgi:hypothetical protein
MSTQVVLRRGINRFPGKRRLWARRQPTSYPCSGRSRNAFVTHLSPNCQKRRSPFCTKNRRKGHPTALPRPRPSVSPNDSIPPSLLGNRKTPFFSPSPLFHYASLFDSFNFPSAPAVLRRNRYHADSWWCVLVGKASQANLAVRVERTFRSRFFFFGGGSTTCILCKFWS